MIGRGSSDQRGLDGNSGAGLMRLLVVALPFLLLLGMLVVVSAAFADPEGTDGATPQTVLTPQLINEAISSPTEEMGISETDPDAAQQMPHDDLDRGEALDLLTAVFGAEVESPAGLLDEMPPAHFLTDNAAVMQSGAVAAVFTGEGESPQATGGPVLIESSVPLRTEDEDGRNAPVDLSLEHSEGEMQPANPLVKAGIPAELGEGISLANGGVELSFPEAAAERSPSTVEGNAAFYPNVQEDSDLVVAPVAGGIETLTQLRTPQAPRTQTVHVSLPDGAMLKETEAGGAEASLNGRVLMSVPPPTALDAAGNPVPAGLSTSGDKVNITVSPTPETSYPILVDPLWRYEIWNWTWENSSLATWEGVSSTASYQSLPYTYWDPGHLKGLDMTSGLGGSAKQYDAANWYFHVPRFNSDQNEFKNRPESFISFLALGNAEFLLQGNKAFSPVMVAGIVDESLGKWAVVGQRSGTEGELSGWSGTFGFENWGDTHALTAVVALTATENESTAKYRNAFVATGWVGMSDRNTPSFLRLQGPSEWMNAVETSHISYSVEDPGLGVFDLQLKRPQESSPVEYQTGCSGLPASPCKRVYDSTAAGTVNLPLNLTSAPTGIDVYKVRAEDPLGSLHSAGQGESPGGESTPHAIEQEVKVKVDHAAPTLALSGSLTEQATLGTARSQYVLRYSAADGGEEMPAYIASVGSEGTAAGQFKHPADVALDSNGKLWVTDENNNRIEHQNEKGEFTAYGTLGSGNGQLNHPTGIDVDSAGNVWVADTGNNRIEEFNSKGEYVRAFGSLGSTNGKLSAPQGIAVDPAGNVWVADTGNNRIEEFSSIGTFLGALGAKGSATGQLIEPAALDIGPAGNVWVADTGNNRIEEFSEAGEFLAAYGSSGAGNGQLSHPAGIDVDTWGNVWVLDQGNNRVEQFSERGEYLGKFGSAGTGAGQFSFSAPVGLAATRAGLLWVTDSGANRIESWSAPQGTQSGIRTVAVKVDGKVVQEPKLTCETGGCPLVGEWTLQSGNYAAGSHTVEVIATDGVGLSTTQKRTISLNPPMPTLSISGTMTEQASLGTTRPTYALSLNAGTELGNGTLASTPPVFSRSLGSPGSGSGQLSRPADVAVNSAGNLWVADYNNNRVEELSSKGVYLAQVGTAGSGNGQLSHPSAVALDAKGDILVADAGNKRIEEFGAGGEYLRGFGAAGSGNGQFGAEGPRGIAVDAKGNIWAADTTNSRVEEFTEKGEFVKVVGSRGGATGQLSEPVALDVAPNGNVWVADWGNQRVEVYNEAGEYVRQFGSEGSGQRQFKHPDGVVVDASGNVWVGDQNNERFQEFNQSGRYLTEFGTPGSGEGQLNLGFPFGIAADPQGVLWVTDSANNRIERWREPSRSLIKTEVLFDNTPVESGEVLCTTESCAGTLGWTLESSGKAEGKHTVVVKATDGFGNTTSKTLTMELQRDNVAPTLTVSRALATAPEGWVEQDGYEFSASAADPNGYGVTALQLKIDGSVVASSSQSCPAGGCGASISKSINMASYSGGAHAAEVIAVDGAGHVTTHLWTINVDPEGHVTTDEATKTLEAVEETSGALLVGPSAGEEGLPGGEGSIHLESGEGEMTAAGAAAPVSLDPAPGGAMTVEIPKAYELDFCGEGEAPEVFLSEEEEWKAEEAEACEAKEGASSLIPLAVEPLSVKEGAGIGNLVEEAAVVSANTGGGADTLFRPLTDGGMFFAAIRDDSAPESYSWRVDLAPNQELKWVDEHDAAVYYNDNTIAFWIRAKPASDAIGTEVPTSIGVSGQVVTLTVHFKAGHEGKPFVFPVVGGAGWEGGFRTIEVEMGPNTAEEEGGEGGAEGPEPGVSEWFISAPEPASPEELQGSPSFLSKAQKNGVEHRRFRWIRCHPVDDAVPPYQLEPDSCGNPFQNDSGADWVAFNYAIRGAFFRLPGVFAKHLGTQTQHIECKKMLDKSHFGQAWVEWKYYIAPDVHCEWYGKTKEGEPVYAPYGKHITPYGEWNWGVGNTWEGPWERYHAGLALYIWASKNGYIGHHETTCIDC